MATLVASVAKRMRPPLGWVARFQTGSRTTSLRRAESRHSSGAFSRNQGSPKTGSCASGKGIQRIVISFLSLVSDRVSAAPLVGTVRVGAVPGILEEQQRAARPHRLSDFSREIGKRQRDALPLE